MVCVCVEYLMYDSFSSSSVHLILTKKLFFCLFLLLLLLEEDSAILTTVNSFSQCVEVVYSIWFTSICYFGGSFGSFTTPPHQSFGTHSSHKVLFSCVQTTKNSRHSNWMHRSFARTRGRGILLRQEFLSTRAIHQPLPLLCTPSSPPLFRRHSFCLVAFAQKRLSCYLLLQIWEDMVDECFCVLLKMNFKCYPHPIHSYKHTQRVDASFIPSPMPKQQRSTYAIRWKCKRIIFGCFSIRRLDGWREWESTARAPTNRIKIITTSLSVCVCV